MLASWAGRTCGLADGGDLASCGDAVDRVAESESRSELFGLGDAGPMSFLSESVGRRVGGDFPALSATHGGDAGPDSCGGPCGESIGESRQ